MAIRLGLMPSGADRLLHDRLAGREPGMVNVSLIGYDPAYSCNTTVFADIGRRYDWRFLAGLQVCLLVRPQLATAAFLTELATAVRPGELYLWDVQNRIGCQLYALPDPATIDKPPHAWSYQLFDIPWTAAQNRAFFLRE